MTSPKNLYPVLPHAPKSPAPSFTRVLCHRDGFFEQESDETQTRTRNHLPIDSYQVDTGAQLVAGVYSSLDSTESLRIRYVSMYAECYLDSRFRTQAENRQAYSASHV
jgi:hypothetical protein